MSNTTADVDWTNIGGTWHKQKIVDGIVVGCIISEHNGMWVLTPGYSFTVRRRKVERILDGKRVQVEPPVEGTPHRQWDLWFHGASAYCYAQAKHDKRQVSRKMRKAV